MTPTVCIPWRAGDLLREQNWQRARTAWEEFGFAVVTGDSEGPWRTAAARNAAARSAGDWDAIIFSDADVVLESRAQGVDALALAAAEGGYVSPYSEFCYLDRDGRVARVAVGVWIGIFAVCRDLWEMIGGFDERFPGNDGEDVAFVNAAATLGPTPRRLPGRALHLWHEPRTDRIVTSDLADRYRRAVGDPAAMRAILDCR